MFFACHAKKKGKKINKKHNKKNARIKKEDQEEVTCLKTIVCCGIHVFDIAGSGNIFGVERLDRSLNPVTEQ